MATFLFEASSGAKNTLEGRNAKGVAVSMLELVPHEGMEPSHFSVSGVSIKEVVNSDVRSEDGVTAEVDVKRDVGVKVFSLLRPCSKLFSVYKKQEGTVNLSWFEV